MLLRPMNVFALTLLAICWSTTAAASSPIVIVPGILGNQLQAKLNKDYAPHEWCSTHSDWYTVWVSIEQLAPYAIDCFLNNTRMLFNDGKYSNCEGVQIRAPGFGDTDTVEHLDPEEFLIPYFHDFVKFFTKHGYVKGVSLRAAPYDWRLSPDLLQQVGYYSDVQNLVETMYKDSNNTRVTIVTHSLGSPTTLYFLTQIASQEWKDKYLKAFVPLSGVWKGAAKTLISVITGNPEGIPLVKAPTARYLQRTSPTNYFLMPVPDPKIWSSAYPVVITPEKNYSVFDYQALFNDMKYPMGYSQYQILPTFLTELAPPNVTTYCYYGTQVHTPLTMVYKEGQFPDTPPTILTGNGDGTVNDISLEACSAWRSMQPSYNVELRSFPGVSHVDMVTDGGVLQAVLEIVTN